MNYLTNYYKNLSEQLQEKVNILESYLSQLNEDLEPGTIVQGYGSSNTSTTTNQNDNPDLNNFLQAWGSSDPSYDYNRDGVVDGNDLGIFLSNMISNRKGTSPATMASTVAAGTPGIEAVGGQAPKTIMQAKAIDQPGVAGNIANRVGAGKAISATERGGKAVSGVEKKNQATQKLMPKTPYSQGTNLSTAKFSPSQTPSDIINAKFERMASKKGSGGFDVETETSRPKVPYSPQVGLGTDRLKTNITPSAGTFTTKAGTDGENPPPQTPGQFFDFNGDGFVDANDMGDLLANWGLNNPTYDYNQDGAVNADDMGVLLANWGQVTTGGGGGEGGGASTDTNQASEQEDLPYWMSGKSTNVDTGFRSMQRRKRK